MLLAEKMPQCHSQGTRIEVVQIAVPDAIARRYELEGCLEKSWNGSAAQIDLVQGCADLHRDRGLAGAVICPTQGNKHHSP